MIRSTYSTKNVGGGLSIADALRFYQKTNPIVVGVDNSLIYDIPIEQIDQTKEVATKEYVDTVAGEAILSHITTTLQGVCTDLVAPSQLCVRDELDTKIPFDAIVDDLTIDASLPSSLAVKNGLALKIDKASIATSVTGTDNTTVPGSLAVKNSLLLKLDSTHVVASLGVASDLDVPSVNASIAGLATKINTAAIKSDMTGTDNATIPGSLAVKTALALKLNNTQVMASLATASTTDVPSINTVVTALATKPTASLSTSLASPSNVSVPTTQCITTALADTITSVSRIPKSVSYKIPNGATQYMSWYNTLLPDYSANNLYTPNLAGSPSTAIVNHKLRTVINQSITYPIDGTVDGGQVGCIRFKVTPMYTGSGGNVYLFVVQSGLVMSPSNNAIHFIHSITQNLLLYMTSSSGAVFISSVSFGQWLQTSGREYQFELNWDLTAGAIRLFIDGMQQGSTLTTTAVRTSADTIFIGGTSNTRSVDLADWSMFPSVQHTTNYSLIPSDLVYIDNTGVSTNTLRMPNQKLTIYAQANDVERAIGVPAVTQNTILEVQSNKVTSISALSSDTEYPSALAVHTYASSVSSIDASKIISGVIADERIQYTDLVLKLTLEDGTTQPIGIVTASRSYYFTTWTVSPIVFPARLSTETSCTLKFPFDITGATNLVYEPRFGSTYTLVAPNLLVITLSDTELIPQVLKSLSFTLDVVPPGSKIDPLRLTPRVVTQLRCLTYNVNNPWYLQACFIREPSLYTDTTLFSSLTSITAMGTNIVSNVEYKPKGIISYNASEIEMSDGTLSSNYFDFGEGIKRVIRPKNYTFKGSMSTTAYSNPVDVTYPWPLTVLTSGKIGYWSYPWIYVDTTNNCYIDLSYGENSSFVLDGTTYAASMSWSSRVSGAVNMSFRATHSLESLSVCGTKLRLGYINMVYRMMPSYLSALYSTGQWYGLVDVVLHTQSEPIIFC